MAELASMLGAGDPRLRPERCRPRHRRSGDHPARRPAWGRSGGHGDADAGRLIEPDRSGGGLAERWLILPIDFDAAIGPDLLREADAFFVDDIDQFRHYREQGWFRGWPEPDGSVGSELDGDGSRPIESSA